MSPVLRHTETAINSDGRRRCYKPVQIQLKNRDSSVGIVTRLRVWIPTNRGSISGRGKCPARLWVPLNLVFKRNWGLLPRGWKGHYLKLTIHLQPVKTLRMNGVIPPHTDRFWQNLKRGHEDKLRRGFDSFFKAAIPLCTVNYLLYWYHQHTTYAKTRCINTTELYLASCFGR